MASSKRYYWLKLKEDFFGSKYIKYIRAQDNGDLMLCVYLELQLKSLKNVGTINYDKLLPSCAEEVAFDLGETVEIVNRTISLLEKLGLLEFKGDGSLYLPAVKDVVGSETPAAERQRRRRARDSAPNGEKDPEENPYAEWGTPGSGNM